MKGSLCVLARGQGLLFFVGFKISKFFYFFLKKIFFIFFEKNFFRLWMCIG